MKRTILILALVVLCLLTVVFTVEYTKDDSTEAWTFAVFCDTRGDNNDTSGKSGINDALVDALAAAIVNDSCDLVLVPGDMINGWWANGSTSYAVQFTNWKSAMEPVYSARIHVYTVRGNHEDGSAHYPPEPPYSPTPDPSLKAAYLDAFGADNPVNGPVGEENLTYAFTHKNAFFVGLDEYINPHRVNQVWLERQLENNSQSHVFVFGHAPAFEINHPDCLAYYSTERDAFWNSIGSAGGEVYFCGHDHLYNRAHVLDNSSNEIHQIVVGSCGAPFKSWSPPYAGGSRVVGAYHNDTDYGYVLATVESETVRIEWKAWDGVGNPTWTTRDSFSFS
jgi:hypothetical protein